MHYFFLAVLLLVIPVNAYAQDNSKIDEWCNFLSLFGLCDPNEIVRDPNPYHYARIENGTVTNVIIASYDFVRGQDGTWVKTAPDSSFRNVYAGIGYSYSYDLDMFLTPKPQTDAVLNQTDYTWIAPQDDDNDSMVPLVNGT